MGDTRNESAASRPSSIEGVIDLLRDLLARLAPPRGRERLATVVAWCAGLACLAGLVQRFRYAADLTDEAFSIALPYRFVLGDKPFVDEISIQQTAGIVLFPFVWLFVKLRGGTTGLVLFVRLITLVFKAAAALGVYATARRWLRSRAVAIAVSFVPFAFVPHSIPNVGYNLIGMSLLTAGTFLTAAGAATTSQKKRLRLFFLAGLTEGIMSFAYPPMVVAALLGTPLVLLCAGPKRWSAMGAFVAGGLAALLLVSPSLAFGGVAGVRRAVGWGVHAGAASNASMTRVHAVFLPFWNMVPTFFTYALVGLVLAWLLRSRTVVAILVPAITLALGFWFRDEFATSQSAIRTVIYTGALSPALVVVAKPSRVVWRGVVLVVVPSFAAAVAAACVSTQNTDAACLGLASGVALFALLAARSLENIGADPTYCMLPAFALMLVLVTRTYDYVYRDAPIAQLTHTVANGPFKGIRTTPDRAQAFAEMHDIAKKFDAPQGRILFLYEASGYYLFSRMKPSAHCVWEESYGDQDGMLAYWESRPRGRGIVVKIKGSQTGRIDTTLTPPERKIYETRHFIVYADADHRAP